MNSVRWWLGGISGTKRGKAKGKNSFAKAGPSRESGWKRGGKQRADRRIGEDRVKGVGRAPIASIISLEKTCPSVNRSLVRRKRVMKT